VNIAIVGSGVSGLACAHLLHPRHDVTVFEADDRAGGHANTVTVPLASGEYQVDTGFIVYNETNYPLFTRLLDRLGVGSRPSDMSFSVSDEEAGLEWRGSSPATVFAQPANLVRPAFLRMLADIGRFNRRMRRLLTTPPDFDVTLADFLADGNFSAPFIDWYLVPLASAIWSADPATIAEFPAASLVRFFDNHGLLSVRHQLRWRTVVGGSENYVAAIARPLGRRLRLRAPVSKLVRRADGVEVASPAGGIEEFDHVIVATHSDQALRLLSDPTRTERDVLGAIGYRPNVATLHTDASLLPRRPRARASWNWHRLSGSTVPTLTYDLGRLQGIESGVPICLTLNRPEAVDPRSVIETMTYWHPVFDAAALRAQQRHSHISGQDRISYCGAYWGFGFHEDGMASAQRVCAQLGVEGL